MDPQILEFLEASNLVSVQSFFEGYDFDTFKKLEPHHLRELIESPKERILFEIKFNELKKKSFAESSSKLHHEVDALQFDYQIHPIPADATTLDVEEVLSDRTFVITESQSPGIVSSNDLKSDPIRVTIPDATPMVAKVQRTYSKISDVQSFEDMIDFDMDIVYAKYLKNGLLEPADRGKVSRCIVKFLLRKSESKIITRTEFQYAAGIIVATFPGENEASYYIPSEGDESASGRLYQTYKSVRTELAEAGLITTRAIRKKKKAEKTDNAIVTGADNATVGDDIDVSVSFEYLATHTDDKIEILKHWSNSKAKRLRMIGQAPIGDYFEKFPILSMVDGYEWLLMDLGEQYPASKNAMDKWKNLSPKLLWYVSQKAKKNPHLRDMISAYDQSVSAQMSLSFNVLPWILRNPTKSSKKKGGKGTTNRPNQLEVADNFIIRFNTDNDDTRTEGNFIEVKLIGSNSNYHTYVYVGSIQYIFADISAGLDCAFKLYYVFNLVFPKTSAHVWEFLNLAIYNINVKGNQTPNFEILSDIQRQVI